jgi:signal transduction histidine kinase
MAAGPTDDLDVLLVEDNPADARLIRHHLREGDDTVFEPPSLTHVDSLSAAFDRLADDEYDLVLLDLGLADSRGIETLERLNERSRTDDDLPRLPVVVLTGLTDDETALQAIQEGAQDYLLKNRLDGALLERAIRYALERHRQERTLERQNERLERFASIVSHDLRNPLNVAQGRISHERGRDDSEHLANAAEALDRMERLVDDLLELAREGRRVETFETVDVADVARAAWDSVETPASDLEVTATGTVSADASRLTQLFENLFRNAVEHGPRLDADPADGHARPGVTVTVGALPDGLYVADDGVGIPAAEREAAFESGYTTAEDGTGFGLDIVTEIVEAHGWTIDLRESAGGGARFEIGGMERDTPD